MGRIFETRKHTMFARWDRMAKTFTRLGKEVVMAVKAGGADATGNPALRRVLQNCRAANMPKDKIENAIKRAQGGNAESYEELIYEGYAPHGIAVLVTTATDNPTRTVANIRMHFNKCNGNMGNSGSVAFMFTKMGVFRLSPQGIDAEELELELIDHGLEELGEGTDDEGNAQLIIRCAFNDFGRMQTSLESRGLAVISAEAEFIPTTTTSLSDAQAEEVMKLVDRLEQDDDVQKVFHNLV